MKKIWILNHYATASYYNGGGRHLWFAKNLKQMGYKPSIFCASTNHHNGENMEFNGESYITKSRDGIEYIFIKTPSYEGNGISRFLNMIVFLLNILKVYKKIIKNNSKPDIIYASSVHPLTLVSGIKIAKKLGIPCVSEIRDLWPEALIMDGMLKKDSIITKMLEKGEKWIYEQSHALIFLKKGDPQYIVEKKWDRDNNGKIDLRNIFYINNGVDLQSFDKNSTNMKIEDEDLSNNKFKVIYTGAIRPVNNVGKLLDVGNLLKQYPDIEILIYGDGNEFQKLVKRIENEKLSNVKMKGYIIKSKIPYILSKSSLNILNYSKDYNWSRGNSSNKIFEYMASATPIVSTVEMGYSPIKKYNCGVELKNGTPEELAESILNFYNMDSSKYNEYSVNARKAAEQYDYKNLTDDLLVILNSTINKYERGN